VNALPRFRKSETQIPACCRLDLPVDTAPLAAEFDSRLWRSVDRDPGEDRLRYFVVGAFDFSREGPRSVLAKLPATRALLDSLPGEVVRVHYSILPPRGFALPHIDGQNSAVATALFERTLRLHFPVCTNPRTAVSCAEDFFHLPMGGVYSLQNRVIHGALNLHAETARIHLIADVAPNAALLALLAAATPVPPLADPTFAVAYHAARPRRAPIQRARRAVIQAWGRLQR